MYSLISVFFASLWMSIPSMLTVFLIKGINGKSKRVMAILLLLLSAFFTTAILSLSILITLEINVFPLWYVIASCGIFFILLTTIKSYVNKYIDKSKVRLAIVLSLIIAAVIRFQMFYHNEDGFRIDKTNITIALLVLLILFFAFMMYSNKRKSANYSGGSSSEYIKTSYANYQSTTNRTDMITQADYDLDFQERGYDVFSDSNLSAHDYNMYKNSMDKRK